MSLLFDRTSRRRPSVGMRAQMEPAHHAWGRANLVTLGWCAIGLYLLSFFLPTSILDMLRVGYLGTSVVFLIAAAFRKDSRIFVSLPPAIALVLQIWSIVTAVIANLYLGRPMGMGRPELYIVEALIPFFVVAQLVALDERQRANIMRALVGIFFLSCLVGWLQFLRIPPAIALSNFYTYKSIDHWDGKAGVRAVGLTAHPNLLSMQATIGFAMVAFSCLWRKLTKADVALILFFSGAAITSQGRGGIIGLVLLWGVFIACLWRSERVVATRLLVITVGLMTVASIVAPNRLGYLMQSSSTSEDSSYSYREYLWEQQMSPIYPRFAMTGIGPSGGILLGNGPEDKWVPIGKVMENAYRLHLAMYGIPGLSLYIILLLTGLVGSARVLFRRNELPQRRAAAGMGLGVSVVLIVGGTAGNTVDGYFLPQLAWITCGLCIPVFGAVWRPRAPAARFAEVENENRSLVSG